MSSTIYIAFNLALIYFFFFHQKTSLWSECRIEREKMKFYFLGFLIDFVSGPVSSGFTSAVALIIVTSQIKDILGIPAKGSQFIEMWQNIGGLIHKTSAWDATLGASCIALLLILRVISFIIYYF